MIPLGTVPFGIVLLNKKQRLNCKSLFFFFFVKNDTKRNRPQWYHLSLRMGPMSIEGSGLVGVNAPDEASALVLTPEGV